MKVRFVEPERVDPNRDRGITVPYAPAKRHQARWRWYLILLVVSSPLLYFCGSLAWSAVVVEAPAVVSQEQITVRAGSQGYVDEVFVKPMDPVTAGAPLVRLRNPDMSTRLAQLKAELQAMQSVPVGGGAAAPVSTVNLQDQLDIVNNQRSQLDKRLDMVQELYDQGAATEAELNAARNDIQQADANVAKIYQEMEILNRPPDGSAGRQWRAQLQARVLSLRAEIAALEKQSDNLMVYAPSAGRVVDLALVKGDQMAIGSKVAMIAPDHGRLHVNAYLPPRYIQYAHDGLQATVIYPDGRRRPAQVIDVPDIAEQVPSAHPVAFGNQQVGVLVRLAFTDDEDGNAAAPTDGLPVKVRFNNRWNSDIPARTERAVQSAWNSLQSAVQRWRS